LYWGALEKTLAQVKKEFESTLGELTQETAKAIEKKSDDIILQVEQSPPNFEDLRETKKIFIHIKLLATLRLWVEKIFPTLYAAFALAWTIYSVVVEKQGPTTAI
jgi:hypothetical protein